MALDELLRSLNLKNMAPEDIAAMQASMPAQPMQDDSQQAAPAPTEEPVAPKEEAKPEDSFEEEKPALRDQFEQKLGEQLQDAGKYTPSKSLMPDSASILQQLKDAQEQSKWGTALSAIARGLEQYGTAKVGGGYLKPNENIGAPIESIMNAPKQNLQETLTMQQQLDALRRAQEQLEVGARKEGRQEVRDIGKTIVQNENEKRQQTRDDKRIDNETKKLGLDALKTDAEVTNIEAQTKNRQLEAKQSEMLLNDASATRNPNSAVSKAAINFYADQLDNIEMYDLADQMRKGKYSMNDAKSILGANNLQNLVTQFNANQLREQLKEEELANKKEIAQTKIKADNEKKADDFRKEIAKIDDKTGYTKTQNLIPAIEHQLASPNGVNDVALLYDAVKILDPKAVLRKDKAQLVIGADSPLNRIANFPNKITRGDVFSPQQRKALVTLVKQQAEVNRQYFQQSADPVMNRANELGLDQKNYMPTSYTNVPQNPVDRVKVKSPDGRVGSMPRSEYERAIKAGKKFEVIQ